MFNMPTKCIILLFLLFVACTQKRNSLLDTALEQSYGNRGEWESVINHYASNPEKQEAARFLIANMLGKLVGW